MTRTTKPGPAPTRTEAVEVRIRLDPSLKSTLELEAKAAGRSLSSYIERLLLRRQLTVPE